MRWRKDMIEIGSVIRAYVIRVEPYGIYLKHGDETVIVLAPEVSWSARDDLRQRVHVGEAFDVLVLRYNYKSREIVGSIRRLHPEENPYRHLSRLEPGEVLRGKVKGVYKDGVTIVLPSGAWGHISKDQLQQCNLKAGDEVAVIIAGLEVDEGRLTLGLAPERTISGGQPIVPTCAGTPS